MKKIYTILLLATTLFTTSCSDWLDVAPSNQVNGDKLFEVGDGYRNALNGVYLNLGTSSMYGQALTWGFMDVIAQCYESGQSFLATTSTYYKAANYQFEDTSVKSIISGIWSTGYNNIANCNNLINNVSKANPSVFAQDELEKNMIWGEALALRALIHFDMLRMFAPSMSKDDGKSYIPYVDAYPTIVPPYANNKEILKKVVNDLKAAKDLLAKCDTIEAHKEWMSTGNRMLANNSQSTGELASKDIFFAYRGYRMNYYAITAMLARVYCWAGEFGDAYKEAKEVVDAAYLLDGSKYYYFDFSNALTVNRKDYNSLIMTFFKSTCYEDYLPYMTKSNDVNLVVNVKNLFGSEVELDNRCRDLYGTWDGGDIKCPLKYDISTGVQGTDMIPGIRLSEMYYIMGEYFALNNEFSKAGEMLDIVRYGRGISTTNLASSIGSQEIFYTELMQEMRREFVGEGQMFFQYKRLDQKPNNKIIFVFDKPDNEDI